MGKTKFWSSEKIMSMSAILVSLCTLIVFLYQTNLIRKQQYMSVFPYVTMANYGGHTQNYKFIIENNGIGPAIIKSVSVTTKAGQKYDDIVDYVWAELDGISKDSVGFYYANIKPGRLIPEGGLVEAIGLSDKKIESANILANILNSEDTDIDIIYESIYGEKWILTSALRYPVKYE